MTSPRRRLEAQRQRLLSLAHVWIAIEANPHDVPPERPVPWVPQARKLRRGRQAQS